MYYDNMFYDKNSQVFVLEVLRLILENTLLNTCRLIKMQVFGHVKKIGRQIVVKIIWKTYHCNLTVYFGITVQQKLWLKVLNTSILKYIHP